jgi:pilus assembly protein CpaE
MQFRSNVEPRHSGRQAPPVDGISVATVGLDSNTADTVRHAILEESWAFEGEFPEYESVIANPHLAERGQRGGSLIWVIDFDKNEELAAQAATALQGLSQGRSASIAVSERSQPELILCAMRAGCSEYLEKPLHSAQLLDSIVRQKARWLASEDHRGARHGKVLAFLGVRGGAGATTLAVHVATFLAKIYNKKTLLVDQHRHLGHAALFLGLDTPGYSFSELVRNVERLDNDLLASFVAHHSSGVDVLSSPASFDESDEENLEFLERTLKFLADAYEYVVVDCATGLEEDILSTVACCDELYLIANQDVPALRDLSRYLEHLLASDIPSKKLKVVLNRYSSDRSVTVEQIEKTIRRPVFVCVPNNPIELVRAVDMGTPIASDRKNEFVHQLKKWTASLVPQQTAANESRRRFSFWS